MLTSAQPEAPMTGSRLLRYQCQAAAYPMGEVRSIPFGAHIAASPRLALRWLRERTRHVTDQLDTTYAQPGLHWLTDEAEHERALAYLTTATGYQLTLYDDTTRYVLAVYPTGAAS